jgi:succinate dehydrogenase / fumarate reductase flavoprotein subunit
VSVHGANRLGTNSLLDIVVFGRRGGARMAEFAAGASQPALPVGIEADTVAEIERLLSATGTEKVADIRSDLQAAMTEHASVFRTEDSLSDVQATIGRLRDRYSAAGVDDKGTVFNYDLTEALELGFLLDIAEALVVSALARTESRGGHFRNDFPKRDDVNWMKHTVVRRSEDGKLSLEYKPVAGGRYQPMERKY